MIRRGLKAPPLVCVSWAKPSGESGVVHHRDAHDLCQQIFEGESVWGNAAYDLAVIANCFPDLTPLIFEALAEDRIDDVIIRQRLIDIAKAQYYKFYIESSGKTVKITYSVAAIAKRLLGVDLPKEEWRLKYAELYDVPVSQWPQGAIDYSLNDSRILLPIWEHQEANRLFEPGSMSTDILLDQHRQVRAAMALHLCSAWGMRTSRDAVQALDDRTKREFEELQVKLSRAGLLHNKGTRNTKRAKEILLSTVPIQHLKPTPTGARKMAEGATLDGVLREGYITIDEETCMFSGNPDLVDYARYGAVMKLRSTYVNAMWTGVKYPLQPNFLVLVETGRTSCSSPNCQNFPREPGVRECCVPRDGCVFIACDYDKAELVSLAETCHEKVGYSRLGDRLLDGFDPHLDMGAKLLKITYDQALDWQKVGKQCTAELRKQIGELQLPTKPVGQSLFEPEHIIQAVQQKHGLLLTLDQAMALQRLDAVKTFRQMAKAANFGLPGGLGADSFIEYARTSYGVTLSHPEAVNIIAMWYQMWKEMQGYFYKVDMDGPDAQLSMSKRIRGGMVYTQRCNTPFQARTADGAKAACWEVTRRQFTVPTSALYGTHMVNFVHDELILELPEARCHEVSVELRAVMIAEFSKFHPKMAKAVNATPVAMRYWSKDAEPLYDAQGCLIPWGEKRYLSAA